MQTGIRTGLKDPRCTADDLHKDMVVQKFIKVLPQISDLSSWGAQMQELLDIMILWDMGAHFAHFNCESLKINLKILPNFMTKLPKKS
jgi:hypothetical protein